METLDDCDQASARIVTQYARHGLFSIVVRCTADGKLRLIYVQSDPERVSVMLEQAAELVFNGPNG